MESLIIKKPLSENKRKTLEKEFSSIVKLTVDIEKEIISVGCFLHLDCYEKLLESGSRPEDVWGANFYPQDRSLDFVSLINIRPPTNRSMDIVDLKIRERVESIIKKLLF